MKKSFYQNKLHLLLFGIGQILPGHVLLFKFTAQNCIVKFIFG